MTDSSLTKKSEIDQTIDTKKGLIAWFARNAVAANLLMIFILVGGFQDMVH